MKRLLAFVVLAFLATASNCGTSPQPVPTPTTDAGNIYSVACANLAAIGCADGTAPNCAALLGQMVDGRMSRTLNLSCLATATTKAAAEQCGALCQ
ncbi:MAG: hypothetical protein ACLP66_10085 [Polyangia bacterium]